MKKIKEEETCGGSSDICEIRNEEKGKMVGAKVAPQPRNQKKIKQYMEIYKEKLRSRPSWSYEEQSQYHVPQ